MRRVNGGTVDKGVAFYLLHLLRGLSDDSDVAQADM